MRIQPGKRREVRRAIENIDSGIIITTRHEDNLALSKYGRPGVLKIAQLHHDYNFESRYVDAFKHDYGNIDYFTLLTPGLVREVGEMMRGTRTKTRISRNSSTAARMSRISACGRRRFSPQGQLNYVKRFDKLIRILPPSMKNAGLEAEDRRRGRGAPRLSD